MNFLEIKKSKQRGKNSVRDPHGADVAALAHVSVLAC